MYQVISGPGMTSLVGQRQPYGWQRGGFARPAPSRLPARVPPSAGDLLDSYRRRVQDLTNQLAASQNCPPEGPYTQVVEVMDREYTRTGRRPIGFPLTVVAAGAASGAITTQPQKPFKSTRLIIPSSIGALFVVTSIQIGNDEMLMNGNPVPALVFNENAEDAWLNLETAQISQNISVNVTNISGAQATFSAAMIGTMAAP